MNFRIQFYLDSGTREPWWLKLRSEKVQNIDDANLVAQDIRDKHNTIFPADRWGIILVELEDERGEREN